MDIHPKNLKEVLENIRLEKIGALLNTSGTLPIIWKCALCRDTHRLNLLENVHTIEIEKPIDMIRPDIVLLNAATSIFSQNEQMVARKSGVLLKILFNHQENKRFLANVCPACGISTGSAYLRSFKRLERKLKGEPTGLLCGKCGKHFT